MSQRRPAASTILAVLARRELRALGTAIRVRDRQQRRSFAVNACAFVVLLCGAIIAWPEF